MASSGIYAIVNTVTRAFYLGSAVNLVGRRQQHRYELRRGDHYNSRLQRAWNKYGEASFEWITVALIEPHLLAATERRLLERLVPRPDCYNLVADFRGGRLGRKHSPETCEKIRAKAIGRRASLETRAQMSAALKGRTRSPLSTAKATETHKRLRAANDPRWQRVAAGQYKDGHPFVGRRGGGR